MRKKVFITGTIIAFMLLLASTAVFAQGLHISNDEAQSIKTEIKEGKPIKEVLERHNITMGQVRSVLMSAGFQHGDHKLSNTQIASIAKKLGLDINKVQAEIEDGKTLHEILNDHDITKEQIRNAFRAEMKSRLEAKKESGEFVKKLKNSWKNKKHL